MAGATPGASGAAAASWPGPSPSLQAMPGLIARIKNMLLSPAAEWTVIEPEPTAPAQLFVGYVAPLAALAALLTFVRMSPDRDQRAVRRSHPHAGAERGCSRRC